jgi:hypothetical protein
MSSFVVVSLLLVFAISPVARAQVASDEPAPAATPSLPPDVELEALFHATIGGQPLAVQSMAGAGLFAESAPDQVAKAQEVLAAQGKTIEDVSVANATLADPQVQILAIRVAGGDAKALTSLVIGMMSGLVTFEEAPGEVAGKAVTVLTNGSQSLYMYGIGDVTWLVFAQEPALTEIFNALP